MDKPSKRIASLGPCQNPACQNSLVCPASVANMLKNITPNITHRKRWIIGCFIMSCFSSVDQCTGFEESKFPSRFPKKLTQSLPYAPQNEYSAIFPQAL